MSIIAPARPESAPRPADPSVATCRTCGAPIHTRQAMHTGPAGANRPLVCANGHPVIREGR